MEENYQGYNQPEYENDDPRKGANKSILGYRIVIIILAVILAAVAVGLSARRFMASSRPITTCWSSTAIRSRTT